MAVILGKVSFCTSQTLLIEAPLLSFVMFGRRYLAVGMAFLSILNQDAEFNKPALETDYRLCL